MSQTLYFEDLRVGQTWRSRGRTVTETDVVNFACLTGDFDPLHVDHLAAQNSPFRRPIAHGLLGLSLVAGLGSNHPQVASLAFVAIQQWEFLSPVYFGDTVVAENEIIQLTSRGKRRGHVIWQRKLLNQSGAIVQQGRFETIVACREVRPAGQAPKATAAKSAEPKLAEPAAPTTKPRRRKAKASS